MRRSRRFGQRLLEVVDYRTLTVAAGFLILALIGYLIVSSGQRADRAVDVAIGVQKQQSEQRAAASRRIDLLQKELTRLGTDAARRSKESGELRTIVAALSEQIRQMGGQPVVAPSTAAAPTPTTVRPRPTPAPTRAPSPSQPPPATPSPTPTCRLPLLGSCITVKRASQEQQTRTFPLWQAAAPPAVAMLLLGVYRRRRRRTG